MKKSLLFLSASIILFSCSQKPDPRVKAEADFKKLSDDYVSGYLAARPEEGVALGYHQYDGKITDFSKAAIDTELVRLRATQNKINEFDTTALSVQSFTDFRLIETNVKDQIFKIEDLQEFTRNPIVYAGAMDVSIYVKRDFAPIEDRLKSIIAIEQNASKVYANAKANLDAELPKPFVETAIEVAQGTAEFLNNDLPIALKTVKNDTLMAKFKTVNQSAVAAINDYADYLKKDKLPKANDKFAMGRLNYIKMLSYEENIHTSVFKLLSMGMKMLHDEQERFNAAARIINPKKNPVDVYHDMQKEHPTADSLIPEAKKHLENIRQFLIDKDLVTIPSPVRVKVEETPEFARSTSTASNDDPGPFEQKATEAYYYITPVDPKWTPQQKEDWLRQFDYYTTDNVTIHEAYPGHYVQFLHLNASHATRVEKIFGSYAYIEGWAHYCEQMMNEAGYGNNGDPVTAAKYRLAQSGDALLRLCRMICSIRLHCDVMSVDEATKFFMDNWHQGEKPSRQEAIRGTFDPGYLYYTLGKLEIMQLRDDYKHQEGANFSLKKFHDAVLDNGMPPVWILREKLLKDSSGWKSAFSR